MCIQYFNYIILSMWIKNYVLAINIYYHFLHDIVNLLCSCKNMNYNKLLLRTVLFAI